MKFNSKILKVLIVVLLFVCFTSDINVNATTTFTESEVVSDMYNDTNFNINNYPAVSIDKAKKDEDFQSLQLIQLVESDNKELLLYVYQPLNNDLLFVASSISMSIGYSKDGQDLNPSNYDLELISHGGVFCKYKVVDYAVSDDEYRYYNIVCIRRQFDYSFDEKISGTELVGNEKAVNCGQQWLCYYSDGEIKYEMNTFETLEIKVKYTGNFEFTDGIKFKNFLGSYSSGQSWFICFDLVDYIADKIIDADMTYKIRTATESWLPIIGTEWIYGDFSDDILLTLTDKDTASYDGGGLFSKKYTWNRIMTSSDFIKNAENQKITISDEVKGNISNSQWVFAFAETEVSKTVNGTGYMYNRSDISDVTILRIKYMQDGTTYNLGVVSDKVNPDNISDGNGGTKIDDLIDDDLFGKIKELFKKIFLILAVVLLIVVVFTFTPVIKVLLQGVIFILSLPIKLIKWIFKKEKNENSKN